MPTEVNDLNDMSLELLLALVKYFMGTCASLKVASLPERKLVFKHIIIHKCNVPQDNYYIYLMHYARHVSTYVTPISDAISSPKSTFKEISIPLKMFNQFSLMPFRSYTRHSVIYLPDRQFGESIVFML